VCIALRSAVDRGAWYIHDVAIACSAGISLYPRGGNDAETLLRNADAATYRAKAGGRNKFQFYKTA
jgi:GGDEF domain-containing protein